MDEARIDPASAAVRLRPMTDPELDAFYEHSVEGYIAHRVASGQDPAQARRIALEQHADYLPGARPSAGHELLVAELEGQRVGLVWIGPISDARDDATRAWIFDIEIDEQQRGRGLGRALLAAAERHAAGRGVVELGLNVFGQNTVARSLYRSAGFVERSVQMSKRLDPA